MDRKGKKRTAFANSQARLVKKETRQQAEEKANCLPNPLLKVFSLGRLRANSKQDQEKKKSAPLSTQDGKTDPNERSTSKDTTKPPQTRTKSLTHLSNELHLQDSDLAMALAVQEEYKLEQQHKDLYAINKNKAVRFVEDVVALKQEFLSSGDPHMNANNFSMVNENETVSLVERLLAKQDEFRRDNKPTNVDIGYHYTLASNMHRIGMGGLLSYPERKANNIRGCNGNLFGDGVYTGNNPYAYHEYASSDTGLFVARLKGQAEHHESSQSGDTTLGQTGPNEVVVCSSAQCVALVQFGSGMVSTRQDLGNSMVYRYHCGLQEIIDKHFNGGQKTHVPQVAPAAPFLLPAPAPTSRATEIVKYTAPQVLAASNCLPELSTIPSSTVTTSSDCVICLERLQDHCGPIACLPTCSHEFHLNCIQTSLQHSKRCPVCRKPIGKPQGKMPSGKMLIEDRPDLTCSGFGKGAIALNYTIVSGIQKTYHVNPGQNYRSIRRTAYLPDNTHGRQLVKRLKYAFSCGLTFTVGTSLTTGQPNSVTWSSIHHKTSYSGGVHGFPDGGYFVNVNEDLDSLNVPAADDL